MKNVFYNFSITLNYDTGLLYSTTITLVEIGSIISLINS